QCRVSAIHSAALHPPPSSLRARIETIQRWRRRVFSHVNAPKKEGFRVPAVSQRAVELIRAPAPRRAGGGARQVETKEPLMSAQRPSTIRITAGALMLSAAALLWPANLMAAPDRGATAGQKNEDRRGETAAERQHERKIDLNTAT